MIRRAFVALSIAGLLAVCVDVTAAAERSHAVRAGESASSISKDYYGSFELTRLLLDYNGRRDPVIRAGEELRIPYSEVHRVESGDSWSALARRYIGRMAAYPIIAELNGRPVEKPLQVGETIVMPVVLRHTLARGESLGLLAERYYASPRRSSLLQEFNRLDDPRRLSVGQTIEIPLLDFQLAAPAKKPAASSARKPVPEKPAPKVEIETPVETAPAPEPPKEQPVTPPQPRFTAQMTEARSTWEAGDYEGAREQLESLRESMERDGTQSERGEFWRLLSFVYIAHDLHDEACAAYLSLVSVEAEPDLDPDFVSPKIRDSLSACR